MCINVLARRLVLAALLWLLPLVAAAQEIAPFVGSYTGEGEVVLDGEAEKRDLSTTIAQTDEGFSVTWTSVITRLDGRRSAKSYTIDFQPSQRPHIYGSAMKTNIFGKQTPLDPLRGEPFVWARLEGRTLSVFSLFILETGGYTLQEYHRTLAEGGLDLMFRRIDNGAEAREVRAFLTRQE